MGKYIITMVEKICPECGESFTVSSKQVYCQQECRRIASLARGRKRLAIKRGNMTEQDKQEFRDKKRSYNRDYMKSYRAKNPEYREWMRQHVYKTYYEKIANKTREVKCAICGVVFETRIKKQKYCLDPECKREVKRLQARKYNLSKRIITTKICQLCEKDFITTRDSQKYCSKECRRRANLDAMIVRYRLKNPMLPKHCEICGSVFTPVRNDVKYCSKPCQKEATKRGNVRRYQLSKTVNSS